MKRSIILGVSAYYHDSAAALLIDGELVAACEEERLSRKKHDSGFPSLSVEWCLKDQALTIADVDYLVFYDKPLLKFDRLFETYLAFAPRGLEFFKKTLPTWVKTKIFLKQEIRKSIRALFPNAKKLPELLFTEHHQSHAASAFFPSRFDEAVVLCLDGVGEWSTSSAWIGKQNTLNPLWEIHYPHSIGLLYTAFTYYLGFKVNSGEYKLMGLAPYGEPKYVDLVLGSVVKLRDDGSFLLDQSYFNYNTGVTMTSEKFHKHFGAGPKKPDEPYSQRDLDLAASIQKVTEEIIFRMTDHLAKTTGMKNLCLAGGVALNCVANGKLLSRGKFESIWIQPAAGDSGGAIGAAYSAWHEFLKMPRTLSTSYDKMKGSYLGPEISELEAENFFNKVGATYQKLDFTTLTAKVAEYLANGKVIGWTQGKMEFGPRALGSRSILGDPRNPEMQKKINLLVKYRESFRPFAPSVLAEDASTIFDLTTESPYMLLVAGVKNDLRIVVDKKVNGLDQLNQTRSRLPAITHVDYSARVQTVTASTNLLYYQLLKDFKKLTGFGVLINTSFNMRGDPIVCTASDAFQCFLYTGIDYLVVGNFILDKTQQNRLNDDLFWRSGLETD